MATAAALTQCIKDVRRVLGDDAVAPRVVRTVPGRGCRFMAAVEAVAELPASSGKPQAKCLCRPPWKSPPRRWLRPRQLLVVSMERCVVWASPFFWATASRQPVVVSPQAQGAWTHSVVLMLLALGMLVGMRGALGVGSGRVLARVAAAVDPRHRWGAARWRPCLRRRSLRWPATGACDEAECERSGS